MRATYLRSRTPCCGRLMTFRVSDVPSQVYTRRCRACSSSWRVTRTIHVRNRVQAVDAFDWTVAGLTDHWRTYGVYRKELTA